MAEKQKWWSIGEIDSLDPRHFKAQVEVTPDSPWFSGHFPSLPIFPGVGVVAAVSECIRRWALAQGHEVRISKISRLRFHNLVQPAVHLEISVETRESLPKQIALGATVGANFRVHDGSKSISQGSLIFVVCEGGDAS